MEELRQEFLIESISALKTFQAKLHNETLLSENFQREIFRRLHTLKGTSQTFNLNILGKLAHEVENVLQAAKEDKIKQDENFTAILSEGVELLLKNLQDAQAGIETAFPTDFAEKIKLLIPDYSATAFSANPLSFLPPDSLKQLSSYEKNSLASTVDNGKNFFLIEAGFDFADFEQKFKDIRQILSEQGEIIATFPSPKFGAVGKIGFQFFFVTKNNADETEKQTAPFNAKLILQNTTQNFANNLNGVLEQAVLTGEKTAQSLDKKIEFEIVAEELSLSNQYLKILSDTLLHLIRNSVDHGIEAQGRITIELNKSADGVHLRVTDDGRGINVDQLKEQARRKKIISADLILNHQEALDLIFTHGFSTSKSVSEISGRGIGLDAVKDSIEKAGGKIGVKSETGKGTTFEIYLP